MFQLKIYVPLLHLIPSTGLAMHLFINIYLLRAWSCVGDTAMNKIDKVSVLMELTLQSRCGVTIPKTIPNKQLQIRIDAKEKNLGTEV